MWKKQGSRSIRQKKKEHMRQLRGNSVIFGADLDSQFHASQGAVTCSYTPEHLLQLIGGSATEIPDDVITAALNLLNANCGQDKHFHIGYYSPAQIRLFTSDMYRSNPNIPPSETIPIDRSSINIHPLNGHWVTSFYDSATGELFVYDSLISDSHLAEVTIQLEVLYGPLLASEVKYMKVTQQSQLPVCGVMAVGFAFSCFLGHDPSLQNYDVGQSRNHLRECISSGTVKPFPVLKAKNIPKKQTQSMLLTSENKYTLKSKDNVRKHKVQSESNIDNCDLLIEERSRKQNVQKSETHLKHIEKNDKHLNENEQDNQMFPEAVKSMPVLTSNRVEGWLNTYIKDQSMRAFKSKKLNAVNKENATMPLKKRDKQIEPQSVSEKGKQMGNEKARCRMQQKRSAMSAHEKTLSKERDRSRKKLRRSSMSAHEKTLSKDRDRSRKTLSRSTMSANEKIISKDRDRSRKTLSRSTMSAHEKTLSKDRDRSRKTLSRSTMSAHEKTLSKDRDRSRKTLSMSSMCAHEKTLSKDRDRFRKTLNRSTMSAHEKTLSKARDRFRKTLSSSTKSDNEKTLSKDRDRSRKTLSRSTMSDHEKTLSKDRDRSRKKLCRNSMNVKLKDIKMNKDRLRKHKIRQSLASKERNLLKEKDRLRQANVRKRKISILSQEHQANHKKKQAEMKKQKRHPTDIEVAIARFKKGIKDYAKYVCTCCNRLLYRRSVLRVNKKTVQHIPQNLQKSCICGKISAFGFEWVCVTCRSYLNRHKLPPQAEANKLKVPDPPEELSELTSLEVRLLCKRYPFMKLMALPKGRQNAIKGSVVNVPVDCDEVCSSLPRTPGGAGIIALKLKRKQEYKNCVKFQYIRPEKIILALKWLQKHNILYQTVTNNATWLEQSVEDDEDMFNELVNTEHTSNCDENNNTTADDGMEHEKESHSIEDCEDPVSRLRGVNYDTCIQNDNPMLDVDKSISIAPGENKLPISILMDEHFEEMAFPKLFPTGKYGFKVERPVKISAKKYFQKRLLDAGTNFAKDVEYLFVAQTITERQQIIDSMSVALRKSFRADESQNITAEIVRDAAKLRKFIFKDQAYRYLQPIRGTPPYWQRVQLKLLAAIKQFGIFTWFFTLSAADLKWHDTLQEILSQQGRILKDSEIDTLSFEQKCTILRSNPVTAARHFQFRLDQFMKEVILSDVKPLGHILHFFYRIEFQQRGSPHAHGVLWVKDAPNVEKDDPHEVVEFVNKYVKCNLPSAEREPELYSLVNQLQRHTHTASCRKSGIGCRFGFPRPISSQTLIAKPPDLNNTLPHCIKILKEQCQNVLSNVKTYLEQTADVEQLTYKEVLENCHIATNVYENALSKSSSSAKLYLEREPQAVMINNFNPSLLLAWEANLDLQFVIDPYACIHYVVSYITKEEREMGMLLQAISKESADDSIKEQMKKCGQAFLNARNVTAQEAAYRALGLPLCKSNFTTVWVPTGLPHQRVSLLKPSHLLHNLEDGDENVFVTSLADKYSNRPTILEAWSLAQFAAWYQSGQEKYPKNDFQPDVISDCIAAVFESNIFSSDSPKTITIELAESKFIMKKRRKQAVIRFHKFSEEKEPESYYHSQLYLFIPWRNETELLGDNQTFQDSYHEQKDTVEKARDIFFKHEDLIETAYQQLLNDNAPIDAWNELAAETQQEQIDVAAEDEEEDEEHSILNPTDQPYLQTTLPTPSGNLVTTLPLESMPLAMAYEEYCTHIQSLNLQQYKVLQVILDWCTSYLQSMHVKNVPKPKPIHLFVTGGAGTGKSYLITAIYQTIQFVLRKEGDNPDCPRVLLLAPTGTAAFNIEGVTIHSGLLLTVKKNDKNATQLSDEKRNTLRVKLCQLQFLIIDEVSMVGSDFFIQIQSRLTEIFGNSDSFGGISIIAVGDMYQLPPVCQKLIFEPPKDPMAALAPSLWSNNFSFMELTEIMRQADDQAFSELLNRVRTGTHTYQDIETLKSRVVNENDPSIDNFTHVYVTNDRVDEYNLHKLNQLPGNKVTLTAIDKIPSSMKGYTLSDNEHYTGGLPKSITIAIGARVVLLRNVDVSDGLANGSQGIVVDIIINSSNNPVAVMISFDLPQVGKNARLNTKFDLSKYPRSVVPITPIEVVFSPRSSSTARVKRIQFPLRLSWAVTIHKIQGATLGNIVVSFQNKFNPGQAYVACSRVKKLTDLYLTHFDEKKIITSSGVTREMTRLRTHCLLPDPFPIISGNSLTLALLNARSARNHYKDILAHPVLSRVDILCITEANMYENQIQHHQRDEWSLTYLPMSREDNCHGLLFYTRDKFPVTTSYVSHQPHLEQVSVAITSEFCPRSFCLVYRSPSSNITDFINDLTHIAGQTNPDVLLGDFNLDLTTTNYMRLSRALKSYSQCVQLPTHRSGSTLDLVYIQNGIQQPRLSCLSTYFSDHSIIALQFDV